VSFFNELKRRNVFKVAAAYIIVAWLLMQVADVVLNNIEAPSWVFQVIMLLLGLGFPIAVIFAWAFEMTPEGLKKEKEVDRSQSITQVTGQKLNYTIMALMALALGYFALDKFWLTPRTGTEPAETIVVQEDAPETIAVLPFVDMSPASDNEYFSDGLTEELLNILAKIQDLQVAGRTSSFAFKGRNQDLREIGEKLGVKTILEGSVRKDESGQRVRITAQLVNVENGFHLWSETYDRQLEDIFAIQDEIAHEVAAALRVTLLGEDEQRIASRAVTGLNAYETYLQGLEEYNDFSYASLREAERLFQQAIELDPDYTPAKIGLLKTLWELVTTGAMGRSEQLARSQPMLEEILAADPGNSQAHVLMALNLRSGNADEAALREFDLALGADPRNADALREMGRFVFDNGDTRRGMEYLLEAERIEPYSVPVLWELCFTHALLLQPEVAVSYCDRIGEVQPENPMRYYGPSMAAQFAGDLPGAIKMNAKAIELDPNDHELPATMAQLWLALGDPERAEPWLRAAERLGADKTATVAARVTMLHYREQRGMAADHARRALQRGLDRRPGVINLIENTYIADLAEQGRIEAALNYYREKRPEAFTDALAPGADLGRFTTDLVNIATLLKLLDPDSERADELLKLVEQWLQRRDGRTLPWLQSVLKASVAEARGQREEALDLIETAIGEGLTFAWTWRVEIPLVMRDLSRDPRFQAIKSELQARLARQRDEAVALLEPGP